MTIIKRIWDFIARIFRGLDAETKVLVPIAISVVQAVKSVVESPVDDVLTFIIKQAISGNADDVLIDKVNAVLKEWLPKIVLELKLVESIANIEGENAQLQAILSALKLSGDETKNIFYHGFGSLILEKLSDGKLSWSDSTAIAEYYYTHMVKGQ